MYISSTVSPFDRLMMALIFAGAAHLVIILGINFEMPEPVKTDRSLDITLVSSKSAVAPNKADYFAQENQLGSGDSEEPPKPTMRMPPPSETIETKKSSASQAPAMPNKPKHVLTQKKSDHITAVETESTENTDNKRPMLTAALLSRQIAQLGAEFSKIRNDAGMRPKIMFINSVNAQKYKAAAYEKAWQAKVERLGNLNYPNEARRKKLSGSLILSVGLNDDGSIYNIKIRHSSGHKVLDDAAVKIVRLAAPFAPFPDALKEQADVLVITRTWKFYNDSYTVTGH